MVIRNVNYRSDEVGVEYLFVREVVVGIIVWMECCI